MMSPIKKDRLSTGISGLDTILNGGFLSSGVYLISGPAGSGKTILANQICFQQVEQGGRAVYITLMSETHARLFSNLDSFTFFKRSFIGESLHYYAAAKTLEEGGLKGLFTFIRGVVRDQRPNVVVIDNLFMTEVLAESLLAFREFMSDLSAYLEASRCTVLLVAYPEEDRFTYTQNMMVDGLILIRNSLLGRRILREIEIVKYRGSPFLEGRHTLQIGETGIKVYPRIEALLATRKETPVMPGRLRFGVEKLDEMLYGGLPLHSTTLLMGIPGSGKTLLGLHFIAEGARKGERGLYFGFNEMPARIAPKADQIGLAFTEQVEKGMIHLVWQSPLEGVLDVLADNLLEIVERLEVRRLFIDGLTGLQKAADYPERVENFLIALMNGLRTRNVTVLLSAEVHTLFGPTLQVPLESLSVIMDNVILMRYVELKSHLYRLISVLKMRESDHDGSIREFRITSNGIQVEGTFESAQGILTGVAVPLNNSFAGESTKR